MSTPTPTLVLASTSPYRRELLSRLGIAFEVAAPRVDERAQGGEGPAEMARRLAREKAREVADRRPGNLVIGSDQTAELDGVLVRKPGGARANIEQLLRCSGRVVRFHTGLCLVAGEGREWSDLVPFEVHFRPLRREWVEWYVRHQQPWDCAGGFRVEGVGIALFERLVGGDPSALVGLPLVRLSEMLREVGIEVLGDPAPARPGAHSEPVKSSPGGSRA